MSEAFYRVISYAGIKRGNVDAASLASQSYWYRLGYIWINLLMISDKRNTPINPLRWSLIDIAWIAYFCILSFGLISTVILLGWFKAYSMKDVEPAKFNWGGRNGAELSTNYTFTGVWYFDNKSVLAM